MSQLQILFPAVTINNELIFHDSFSKEMTWEDYDPPSVRSIEKQHPNGRFVAI
jgi:hypothetical protein